MIFDNNIDISGLSNKRRFLLGMIGQFPGLYFREISKLSEFSIGDLDYNLRKLKKSNTIVGEIIWNKKRYFTSLVSETDRRMIGLLRERNVRKIIEAAMKNRNYSMNDFADSLQVSKSTASWYIHRLKNEGIIGMDYTGRKVSVVLNNESLIKRILSKYSESFSDRLLNNFVSMWEA